MTFEHYDLPAPLSKHIESIFYFKDFTPEHSIERLVPTGHVFIIFELDDIPRNTFDNTTLNPINTYKGAWVSGMHRNFISISAHPHSEMLVIQFKPAGPYPFFHFPLQKINEKIMAAEALFGGELPELRRQLLEAENAAAKFTIAAGWLLNRYREGQQPSPDLLNFIERLQKEPVSRFNEIIASYPYTQKQLIQHFKKYVGITPKYYQRILRFNEILKIIHNKEKVNWADVAYHCDYTDQSHFIKEFSLFSGFNPQEFIKKELTKEKSKFFPIDRKG